jgi:hypothetical protein
MERIESVYKVHQIKSGRMERIEVRGDGQECIEYLRKEFPKLTKFVLLGFKIKGNFVPLNNYAR